MPEFQKRVLCSSPLLLNVNQEGALWQSESLPPPQLSLAVKGIHRGASKHRLVLSPWS